MRGLESPAHPADFPLRFLYGADSRGERGSGPRTGTSRVCTAGLTAGTDVASFLVETCVDVFIFLQIYTLGLAPEAVVHYRLAKRLGSDHFPSSCYLS